MSGLGRLVSVGDDGSLIGYSPSIVDGARGNNMAQGWDYRVLILLRFGSAFIVNQYPFMYNLYSLCCDHCSAFDIPAASSHQILHIQK